MDYFEVEQLDTRSGEPVYFYMDWKDGDLFICVEEDMDCAGKITKITVPLSAGKVNDLFVFVEHIMRSKLEIEE